jgi:hypothetical protein
MLSISSLNPGTKPCIFFHKAVCHCGHFLTLSQLFEIGYKVQAWVKYTELDYQGLLRPWAPCARPTTAYTTEYILIGME